MGFAPVFRKKYGSGYISAETIHVVDESIEPRFNELVEVIWNWHQYVASLVPFFLHCD